MNQEQNAKIVGVVTAIEGLKNIQPTFQAIPIKVKQDGEYGKDLWYLVGSKKTDVVANVKTGDKICMELKLSGKNNEQKPYSTWCNVHVVGITVLSSAPTNVVENTTTSESTDTNPFG